MAQATLPSVVAAEAFWRGEEGAGAKIAGSLLQRAAIVLPALFVAGERKHLLKYTAFTVLAIEAVVLLEVKKQLQEK